MRLVGCGLAFSMRPCSTSSEAALASLMASAIALAFNLAMVTGQESRDGNTGVSNK